MREHYLLFQIKKLIPCLADRNSMGFVHASFSNKVKITSFPNN